MEYNIVGMRSFSGWKQVVYYDINSASMEKLNYNNKFISVEWTRFGIIM